MMEEESVCILLALLFWALWTKGVGALPPSLHTPKEKEKRQRRREARAVGKGGPGHDKTKPEATDVVGRSIWQGHHALCLFFGDEKKSGGEHVAFLGCCSVRSEGNCALRPRGKPTPGPGREEDRGKEGAARAHACVSPF